MLTGQRVGTALGMVEIPQEPPTGVMASLTLRSKHLLVLVDFEMTTQAILFSIPESQTGMALLARGQQMQSRKRKSRLVVVETLTLPTAIGMTRFTLGAELSLVLIVLTVAADTL